MSAAVPAGRPHVLIVDDETNVRRVLATLLEQGWSADQIADALPHSGVVLALQTAYEREGRLERYLDRIESHAELGSRPFVRAYGNAGSDKQYYHKG